MTKRYCSQKSFLKLLAQYFVVVSLLAGTWQSVLAQDTSDSLKVELEPIEVTALHSTISASDAPLSLSTYSRDLQLLGHASSTSLTTIGNQLPGLWVNDRQNYALGERLTIRGVGWRAAFGVRGIQVVYNDMPLTVADGQTMINIVEPAFIRRAELVRGPAATYWGNSSGGVLYLSTVPSVNDENSVHLRTMGGSFGMKKAEAEVSIANPGHQFSAYSSYLATNGFRDYSAAQVLRSGINGSVTLTSKSRLKYRFASIYMPEAEHPSSLTAQQAEDSPARAVPSFVDSGAGKEITQTQTGLSYLLETPAGLLTVTGYGIYRDLSNPLPFGIITVNRWAGGARATLDKSWNRIDLQAGIETKFQNDDRTEFDNIGQNGTAERGDVTVNQIEKVWNQALFSTATVHVGDFNILGGLRYDRLTFSTDAPTAAQSGERTFQSLSPSLGINYQFREQTLFANLSTSFEAPTTTELVNRPGGGNGFNPQLEPEKTLGFETGIRGRIEANSLSYDLTLYRLWIRDLLFPYQLQSNGPTYYRNQGETTHTGLETRISWNISSQWQLSTTASMTKAEFQKAQTLDSLSLAGKQVPGIPDFRINTQLQWSSEPFLASLSHEYVSDYTVNNLNTEENNAYNVWDAKVSYRKIFSGSSAKLQPFINVNNIFDTRYNGSVVVNSFGGRYYEPAPGRNWQLGVSVDF